MNHNIDGMSHEEFHESARKAVAAHHQRLRDDGLMGEERYFTCNLTPGDRIALKRVGPSGGSSTYIAIGMTNHGEGMMVALSPQEARRFAAALLDNIESCDPAKPLLSIPEPPFSEGGEDK